MSLDEKFAPVRTTVFNLVSFVFQKIAGIFGYPEIPGMPIKYEDPNDLNSRAKFIASLPERIIPWPPIQRPETWFETIFGPSPKPEILPRYTYESSQEGFYNFYIENYKNIYFLPDKFSTFLQVQLNICLDISILETIREILFVIIVVYSQLVLLRIALSWFLSVNPFKFPFYYLIGIVDWTEELLQGVFPSILGVNITGSVFLGLLGVVADGLNQLIFTMPFLPSEGEETKLLIDDEMTDVLVFHYLPILWYQYPIPNEIREFWYNERPDILNFMRKTYNDLDIQFLPDNVIQELNDQSKLTIGNFSIDDHFSTQLLSNEFLNNVNGLTNLFYNFF